MQKDFNHFESYEWSGEFWLPEIEDEILAGHLTYSPRNGLIIKLLATPGKKRDTMLDANKSLRSLSSIYNKRSITPQTFTLYGNVFGVGSITIFSAYLNAGPNLFYGNITSRQETVYTCGSAIFGLHYNPENIEIISLWTRFQNLPEFCSDNHGNTHDVFDHNKLVSGDFKNTIVSLKQIGQGELLFPPFSRLLLTKNESVRSDIDSAIEDILKKHGKKTLEIKKEIEYYCVVEPQAAYEFSLEKLLNISHILLQLFAFLMIKKCIPIIKRLECKYNQDDTVVSFCLLESLYIQHDDLDINNYNAKYQLKDTKLRLNDIKGNFQHILSFWSKFTDEDYKIVHEVLYNYLFSIESHYLQSYVLVVAAIDQWVSNADKKKGTNKEKMCAFFKTHTTNKMEEELLKHLCSEYSEKDVGNLIWDLRSYIVHPTTQNAEKKQTLSSFIYPDKIHNIIEFIIIAFFRAIYGKLEIDKDIIASLDSPFRHYYTI